ncbi:uncharacterized protein LOC116291408 [Actinia tenebrosa]|uniref:Uncharacterized protein LOC116291408 n=1 Tax=Actinia tenebrosa TaxID=6105 RepID=A0A6P8HDF6_ACTTE|nr:uncharacterized protein LOC116291408 [Actinia tenebrosa]
MESLGRVASDLDSSIAPNSEKLSLVSQALDLLESKKGTFLWLLDEGGGRRNEMSIVNGTSHAVLLVEWYLERGYVKVPPQPYLDSMSRDEALFHNAGSWACTGSSGIVTYQLEHQTNLHILWECPYSFDINDNYIGLMLTTGHCLKKPNKYLFKGMLKDWDMIGMSPSYGSTFDLVCCGPGDGKSRDKGGSKPYGCKRRCAAQDNNYAVYATMGDKHATGSKITIVEKNYNWKN